MEGSYSPGVLQVVHLTEQHQRTQTYNAQLQVYNGQLQGEVQASTQATSRLQVHAQAHIEIGTFNMIVLNSQQIVLIAPCQLSHVGFTGHGVIIPNSKLVHV